VGEFERRRHKHGAAGEFLVRAEARARARAALTRRAGARATCAYGDGPHPLRPPPPARFAYPLASEKNDNATAATDATFYYYAGNGTLYTSHDTGATFAPTYAKFPSWHVPFFGIATPPHGAAAAGDVWVFAGWKLYHSIDAGATFSQVYQFYELDHVFTLGALPAVASAASGRDAAALSALCAARGARAAAAAGRAPLPGAPAAGAGYVVYALGLRDYATPAALYASVDYGHSWRALSGANSTTPEQGLGDSPYVLEASAKDVGTLFVGTGGRGAFWRDVSADLRAALLACEDEEA